MKCKIIIDKNHEEGVWIYVREPSKRAEDIQSFVLDSEAPLVGYKEKTVCHLVTTDVHAFTVEGNKVYALTQDDKWQLKQRLYQLEELLGEEFVKINQSCIINIKKIQRFEASLSASLMVTLKNGYRDYVSRRQLKSVKERVGFYR